MKTLYESLCESLCEDFFDNVGGSSFNIVDNWCKDNIEGKYMINKKNTYNKLAIIHKNY